MQVSPLTLLAGEDDADSFVYVEVLLSSLSADVGDFGVTVVVDSAIISPLPEVIFLSLNLRLPPPSAFGLSPSLVRAFGGRFSSL